MRTEITEQPRILLDAFLAPPPRDAISPLLPHGRNLGMANIMAYQALVALPRKQQIEVVLEAVARQVGLINGHDTCGSSALTGLILKLLRKKLPFTDEDLEHLVRTITAINRQGWWEAVSPKSIMGAVEDRVTAKGLPEPLGDALQQLAAKLREHTYYAEPREILKRVEALLATAVPEPGTDGSATLPLRRPRPVELIADEVWTRSLRAALDAMEAGAREPWEALLIHCALAASSKPSGKWLKQAQALVAAVGAEAFAAVAGAVLAEVGKPGGPRTGPDNALGFAPDPTQVHDTHADLLRGVVWCTSLVDDETLTVTVGTAADVCFKKLRGIGPRAPKIGNACLWALSNRSTTAAVAQLSRLKTRAKHASVRTQLGKALDTAAEKTGMSAADLEEVAVPTCGLTGVGEYRQQLGDCSVLLQVTDGLKAEVGWRKPDGKTQRSAPASLKPAFADDLKALKQIEKEVENLLPAQRDRLEQLFLQQRSWPLAEFRARFLDHPLVGVIARRLIWRFTDGPSVGSVLIGEGEAPAEPVVSARQEPRPPQSGHRPKVAAGIWHDGRIVDASNRALDRLGADTRVSLWHPLHGSVAEVKAWRDWLEAHEVRQPFRQAHREIYVLTEAERQTGIYSNRFAAQLLKQHQFAALCHQTGWRYAIQGDWDSANTPTLCLPLWNLGVEFLVQPIQERGSLLERGDLVNQMTFRYLTTDQVRFYKPEEVIPLPLAEVPPLLFSEVMRNVDLFVGVASVGNDPTWTDSGLFGHYREYWERFSFGELFPSAQTRKAVLERIVPRLKIADRCSFSDKFLIVRGDLRTYKIHLGSGNILMSPDDQYLCIVPKAGVPTVPGGKVYLPFEGDHLLSIILSKALLAEDRKIKEPTILKQLAPRAAQPVG